MELYDFVGETSEPEKIMDRGRPKLLKYEVGNRVYDVAWDAYIEVLKHHYPDKPSPNKPKDSELRLAFPPST